MTRKQIIITAIAGAVSSVLLILLLAWALKG